MKIITYFSILLYVLYACRTKPQTAELKSTELDVRESEIVTVTDQQINNSSLTTAKAERKTLRETVQVNGKLDVPPKHLVSLTAILGGYVREINALQGMKVRKGQILAVLENPDFLTLQQDYLESLAKLQFMKVDFERQALLNQSNIGSRREYQESESNYNVMEARVHALAQKLRMLGLSESQVTKGEITSRINIASPINGYVTVMNVNMGSFVAPQTVMFEIVDPEHLHAELYVYEKDISKIKKGQLVTISLANDTANTYQGRVFLINKRIEDDRTVRIHVHFLNHDDTMIPGTFIKAAIAINAKTCWVLPEKAVIDADNKKYVFVQLKPKSFKMVAVRKGITQNGLVEITPVDSLNLNDVTFVTNGGFNLLGKMRNVADE